MIKRLIKHPLFYLRRYIYRSHVIILMIHAVVDDRLQATWQPFRPQLSVIDLDKGLATLAKHYHFVSMCQAVAMISGKEPIQPYSLVLTFDDGYRNNVTHALPILKRYCAPAAFFLAVGNIERREPFWYDRLDYAIQHLRKEHLVPFAGQSLFFQPNQEKISRTTFATLRNLIKTVKRPYNETMVEVNRIAADMENNAGCSLADIFERDHSRAIMSWEDVKWAADQGVTIGSHSVDHSLLDRLDENSVREQLVVSKKTIEQHVGRKCPYFCYPNGNWNNKIVSLLRNTGYVAAITTDKGSNRVGDELMSLRRLSFPEV